MPRQIKRKPQTSRKKEKKDDSSKLVGSNISRKTPFKRSDFSFKKGRTKPFKNFKQIMQGENYEAYPSNVANYTSIEAGPSTLPAKKYCDICGYVAKYVEPKTGLRYCQSAEYHLIKSLSTEHVESYLSIRKAVVVIK
jgi:INO80 complex subunit C